MGTKGLGHEKSRYLFFVVLLSVCDWLVFIPLLFIKVFKITHNIYDPEVSPELRYYPKSNTRGNKYKLLNRTFHYDTRKYSFTARIVNIWNSLPNSVVHVDTVCVFNARLDKFWMHQDVIYDFTADLTGIGDRSVCESS